ncbi:uncharacterized protein MYCFIDRAFT_180352 [Pseudocercospora fijiensis CIRAD86]|uniref:Uncharacterized protein n=1 Tax=Pseudocercospora fijiensis (strain CIRAD86) TaxID=383855 RepID=M2ZD25_PSEFD|nr:uncharacterized protein MYCFIDRAFT_180352 [Pseudocercospora fijiensis CIRAD86]EME77019.1 hypothetical protein MYCFIDRAFT_180352 [Pseudocercospora fijiensis CIRAD86]
MQLVPTGNIHFHLRLIMKIDFYGGGGTTSAHQSRPGAVSSHATTLLPASASGRVTALHAEREAINHFNLLHAASDCPFYSHHLLGHGGTCLVVCVCDPPASCPWLMTSWSPSMHRLDWSLKLLVSLAWLIALLLLACCLFYQDSKGIPWLWQGTCEAIFIKLGAAAPAFAILWIPADTCPWCDIFVLYMLPMLGMLWLQRRRICTWIRRMGKVLLVNIGILAVCIVLDPYFLQQSINETRVRAAFEHIPDPQARLPPTMLLTLDAILLPMLHFLAECGPLYYRHNLHSTSYCEVEQVLAHLGIPLDTDITSDGIGVSRLGRSFCHGLMPSKSPHKPLSPPVRLYADQLLHLRSHFASAINSAQYYLLPLLDRLHTDTVTVHRSLSAIDPETLNIFDKAFTNSCPPTSSPLLMYYWPGPARHYCDLLRTFVYPRTAFSWIQLLLGNSTWKLRSIYHQAATLRSRLKIASQDLDSALQTSIALSDDVYTTISNLKPLPTLIPSSATNPSHLDAASMVAENRKVLSELEKLELRADQTRALMRGRDVLVDSVERMLRVQIRGVGRGERNLTSLAFDTAHFAHGLLAQASLIYDVWVQRGRPIRDVSRGWMPQEFLPCEDRLEEAKVQIRLQRGKAALPEKNEEECDDECVANKSITI